MLKIRNLKKLDDHYEMEYQADGGKTWGNVSVFYNPYGEKIINIAENDTIDSRFYRSYLHSAIEQAKKNNTDHATIMWY